MCVRAKPLDIDDIKDYLL